MNWFAMLILACLALLAVDLVNLGFHLFEHKGKFSLEGLPNFYGFFGLTACLALALLSVGLRKVLMRDEGFYDDDVD